MAVLALDLGRKRVGVAISRSGVLAEPIGIWPTTPRALFTKQLTDLISAEQIERIIVGIPHGQQGEWTLSEMERLSRLVTVPLTAQPEEYSTKEAQTETGNSTNHADAIAAVKILERFLLQ